MNFPATDMGVRMTFEYKLIFIWPSDLPDKAEKRLNELGAQGWELVLGLIQTSGSNSWLVFKRENRL
jgi:hypothetical protein